MTFMIKWFLMFLLVLERVYKLVHTLHRIRACRIYPIMVSIPGLPIRGRCAKLYGSGSSAIRTLCQ